ncbi:hypothetical protein BDW66DRAFT_152581 [Aspergillus desertorum]
MPTLMQSSSAHKVEAAKASLSEDGFSVVPNVLDSPSAKPVYERLWKQLKKISGAAWISSCQQQTRTGQTSASSTSWDGGAISRKLIQHPAAHDIAKLILGDEVLVSNFTANMARLGFGRIALHSDQLLVVPEPWEASRVVNILCPSNAYFENRATLFISYSHRWKRRSEVPSNAREMLSPFVAR